MSRHAADPLNTLAAQPTTCRMARAQAPCLTRGEADLLAADPAVDIRCAVAAREDLSVEATRCLAGDEYVAVRLRVVARRQGVPADLRLAFCHDSSKQVRLAMASDPLLPAEGRALLLHDRDLDVLIKIAQRTDLSDDEICTLIEGGGGYPVLQSLAARAGLSEAMALRLVRTKERLTVRFVAGRRPVPLAAAELILSEGDYQSRQLLASDASQPLSIRAKLALDSSFLPPYSLIREDHLHPLLLLLLAISSHDYIRERAIERAAAVSAHEILEALQEAMARYPRRRAKLAAAAKAIATARR